MPSRSIKNGTRPISKDQFIFPTSQNTKINTHIAKKLQPPIRRSIVSLTHPNPFKMPPQLTPIRVDSLPADQRICAICQEALGGGESGEAVKTQCNHAFDRHCITHWLDGDNSTCPICREEIRQVGGGRLRDQLRNVSRMVRRARERDEDEREQMRQAQADYGDTDGFNSPESEDYFPLWEEFEPLPPSSPGNFTNQRPRNHSQPATRILVPTGSRNSMQRAQSEYAHALSLIEEIDNRIFNQARVSDRANTVHHRAERNIQEAFSQLIIAQQSQDRYEIQHALAMQESVTPLLNEAYHALQYEGAVLAQMIGERERADDRLTAARQRFADEREEYMHGVRRMFNLKKNYEQ
ncbi:hypothetical protein DID88_009354 [Monilinia fructigena]|uniref:RING-type domain-containing protein n=1 Tax=Monilinia fructigena TaxID=38457 RepID=A0A395INJ2_9HELO|nr:hypothetical protein DID88_009354 [Monilinia fructigena]